MKELLFYKNKLLFLDKKHSDYIKDFNKKHNRHKYINLKQNNYRKLLPLLKNNYANIWNKEKIYKLNLPKHKIKSYN